MKSGKIWLDYDVDDEEEHFEGNVSRAIFRDTELVIEFSGHNPDEGPFHGSCKLTRAGNSYHGPGTLTTLGKSYESMISLTGSADGVAVELSGTWQINGDAHPYDLAIELEES